MIINSNSNDELITAYHDGTISIHKLEAFNCIKQFKAHDKLIFQ
jgi:hypothetical protein